MLEKLQIIQQRFDEVSDLIIQPDIITDQKRYVQLNKECTRAAIINGDTVLKYPLIPWRNRKATGEYVRQVPISEVVQVIL